MARARTLSYWAVPRTATGECRANLSLVDACRKTIAREVDGFLRPRAPPARCLHLSILHLGTAECTEFSQFVKMFLGVTSFLSG